MSILKKGLTLSIIGITIFVLAFSTWNNLRLDALSNGEDWSKAYTLQYDINGDVVIDHNDYNFIEQGSGIVESVYQPIDFLYTRVTIFYDAIAGFFGLKSENLEQIIQDNNTLYGNLSDVYLDNTWVIDYDNGGVYTFYIDASQSIYYNTLYESYNLNTYYVLFGIRLWRTDSIQLDHQQLQDYNNIYNWV